MSIHGPNFTTLSEEKPYYIKISPSLILHGKIIIVGSKKPLVKIQKKSATYKTTLC